MTESPKITPREDDLFLPHSLFSSSSSSNRLSSNSLAQHYIPDKIPIYATGWGSEARKASRVAAGGWGAAAGPKRKNSDLQEGPSTYKGNGVLFRPELYRGPSGSVGVSSSISSPWSNNLLLDPFSPPSSEIGPPTSGHRNRKWGAGRDAWGQNGGGNPALGAGDFEDDDGLDLSRIRPQAKTVDSILSEENGTTNSSHQSTTALLGKKVSSMPSLNTTNAPTKKRARWNRFKWSFVVMNTVLTAYSLVGFIVVLLVWSGIYKITKVLDLVDKTEMILAMTAMVLCVITSMFGWAGLMLNNRSFLAVYTLLLWISFIFVVAPGYIAYKKRTFNLNGKVNQTWSRGLTIDQRRTVQVTLECCGFYSPFIEAAADSGRCYARSLLPGCKGVLIEFQKKVLQYIYICSFSIVPVHLGLIVTALLCADHITYRFGKGVTPKEYRVDDRLVQQALTFQRSLSPSISGDADLQRVDPTLGTPRPPFWQQRAG